MPDKSVTALLESARQGTETAWREILRRYSPLVFAVCRDHGIFGTDADDVSGNVWLGLLTGMVTIRRPEALPGWLMTATRRECLRMLRDKRRQIPDGREFSIGTEPGTDVHLLAEERRGVVRGAFAQLPQRDRDLLAMLFADPPATYAEISSSLGIPLGAIGPTRQRCLARARRIPSIAALLDDDGHTALPTPRIPLQGRQQAG
ncbi:MAG TPA: sigma-70 family RNA polymerase sigma factor [Actinophytocola sp.]|uniref:RNA polymerase sigma factor n=1 Tax=Actinophytocola sp. TaxID=1872138 RepID=UPI002DB921ED|nr:sigma-70 family RNA polymerase sigma factor [Actinophytocola sp.]HEU5474262.1 sigma-70 family RNA polymerase sigma factor [Actinophytocola sp.]